MRQIHNELISSQQTPRAYLHHDYKYKRGMHSHMFVEDFCRSFSIKLAPIEQHDEFYDVSPADDLLKKLLTFDDYSFFRYSFDKLLDTLMYHLILNGTAYLEIVKWVDSRGTLQGIELVPICVSKGIKAKKVYRFFAKTPDRQSRIMCAENDLNTLYSYLNIVAQLSSQAMESGCLLFWTKSVVDLQEKILPACIACAKSDDKNHVILAAAIADVFIGIYINIIIGINKYLRELNIDIIRKPSSSCLGIECSRYIKTMMDLLKKALSYLTRQRH